MFLRGVLVGWVSLLIGIAAVGLLAKALSQTYAVATITSWHFDREKDYNENNLGLGLEHRLSENWSVSTGFFRNSFYRNTNYLFAGYTPIEISGWRAGVVMGGVTGYEEGMSPWFTGVATRDFGRIGINIVLSPVGMALQLKVRIDK